MAILGTFLGLVVILPINLTGRRCEEDLKIKTCYDSDTDRNYTNFERTTIENIRGVSTDDDDPWWISTFGITDEDGEHHHYYTLWRFYIIVLVSWIMIFYCLHLLKKEWVDALALRRIYYLEQNHWQNIMKELNEFANRSDYEDRDLDLGALRRRKFGNRRKDKSGKITNNLMDNRPPWIPHPEQRDTVPNIELYSVLVGNIPTHPSKIAGNNYAKTEIESSLDWRLRVTVSTYFHSLNLFSINMQTF